MLDPTRVPPPGCPGAESSEAGQASACDGCPNQSACASTDKAAAAATQDADARAIADRLQGVRHVLLVLSGKGGVGKSTVSSQLAYSLAARGWEVGLLDLDICGPSLPRMLGVLGESVHSSAAGWSPVYLSERLGVMSVGFLLPEQDEAVIWRGPRKNGLIRQFLADVDWGRLDFLIVDTPPGTSDEHISVAQYLRGALAIREAQNGGVGSVRAGSASRAASPTLSPWLSAVLVTTPQEVACADVRKEAAFCKKVSIPVLGVVENMGQSIIPFEELEFALDGGADADLAQRVRMALLAAGVDPGALRALWRAWEPSGGGARALAQRAGAPLLGSLPLDARVGAAGDGGHALAGEGEGGAAALAPKGAGAAALLGVVQNILEALGIADAPPGGC